MDPIWDNQFRLHLRNVYKLMGARAPARLFQPIIKRAPTPERGVPSTLISPASKHDPAWAQAGYYLVGSGFGALHRPAGVIERVYYGNDDEKMYFRIDSPRSGSELEQQKIEFWLYISGPPAVDGKGDLELPLPKTGMTDLGFEPSYVVRITPRAQGGKVTVARVLEPQTMAVTDASWDVEDPFAIAIPFGRLGKHGGDALELAVVVSREGRDIEIVPPSGGLGLRVPGLTRAVEVASAKHLKVLVATAELAPFAKLGGVYDVEPYADIATTLTIHNLSAQGVFGFGALMLAGLQEWGLIRLGIPGLDNVVNVLGRGIHFADVVNTVSERYAKEIQTPEYGEGLDELLRRNTQKLHGILNGIDYETFDPQRDPNIPHHYSADAPQNKALCRAALRTELGLEEVKAPLCAIVSRFYDVKGFDLLEQAMPELVQLGLQIVVIGTGDRRYEDMFRRWASEVPRQVAVAVGFDAALAQRIYAGADMLWMPSRFEPGGLAQLIALRYGTIPVVRATGGLADTIRD